MDDTEQLREFEDFMRRVCASLGLPEFTGSSSGLVSLAVDEDYVLNIQFVPATGKMMVFLPFLDAAGLSSSALRELLVANLFGQETGGGWFGLESESGSLVYHYLVDFGLTGQPDLDEFIGILERILELVEIWRVHLTDEENAGDAPCVKPTPEDGLAGLHFLDQIRP